MPKSLPEYANPPVIEVVSGVGFTPLEGFKAIHVGLLWNAFRDQFPRVEEHSPLVMPLEVLDVPVVQVGEVQFSDTPPLPRVWFVDASGNGIVQVQRDALLHNWRKLKDGDTYPRFDVVISEFREHFSLLTKFVEHHQLGAILPLQYELNYVNHIFPNEYWGQGKVLNNIFPDFQWRQEGRSFLPREYEVVNWKTVVRLPNGAGRLHITIQTAFKLPERSPVLVLEMKARGIAADRSVDSVWRWFDLAHEWIVRGFADITDTKIQQKLWGFKL